MNQVAYAGLDEEERAALAAVSSPLGYLECPRRRNLSELEEDQVEDATGA